MLIDLLLYMNFDDIFKTIFNSLEFFEDDIGTHGFYIEQNLYREWLKTF